MVNAIFSAILRNRKTSSIPNNLGISTFKLKIPEVTFLIFYLCVLAGGGASRTDNLSLLYLRPISLISIIVYCIQAEIIDIRNIKVPLIFIVCMCAILMLQILPLPFFNWTVIGEHEIVTDMASGGWRPSSISPDRTLNSLISLVVPLAALFVAQYFSRSKKLVLVAVIIGGLLSGGVAIMQLALGEGNALYLYRLTTDGAVGLFSNRNHQAVMLACLIPSVTFCLTGLSINNVRKYLYLVSLIFLIIILIMVTGSRSGLAASLVGLLCAFTLHDAYSVNIISEMRQRYRLFYLITFVGVIAVAGLTIALGRNLAATRLSELNLTDDLRVTDFPIFLQLAKDHFLLGSGGGTFDPAFRMIEPANAISSTYVNHAHNELIEVAITLGLPGLLMLLAFIWWFVASMINVLKAPSRDRDGYAMLGGCLIAIMMLASLTDYLLRTPLMGAFFAVACAWLSMGSVAAKEAGQARAIAIGSRPALSKLQDDLVL